MEENVKKERVDRKPYTIGLDLYCIKTIATMGDKVDLKTIVEKTGRSEASLHYRYLDSNRGVMKILKTGGIEALFNSYDLVFSEDLYNDLVDKYEKGEDTPVNKKRKTKK